MKHLGIIKKLAGTVAAALVLGSAVLGCSMFDSYDSSDSSDANGGKARLLFSDSGIRSLITPTAVQESDITKAELKVTSGNDSETLKTWNSTADKGAIVLMKEEQNLSIDTGTYDFTLNLYVKLGNEEILCQNGTLANQTVVSGDNLLDFKTCYVSEGNGLLSLSLTLPDNAGVTKIEYAVYALDEELAPAGTAAASGEVVQNSCKDSLPVGYYSVILKLYNGENLLNTLDYTAKIMAGCTSLGVLNITDVNTLHSLTFQLGNDVEWVNEPGEILKNAFAKIKLPAASDIKREGYRLLKWYTLDEDFQTDKVYEPEEEIRIEGDTELYAKWQQVFIVTFMNGEDTSSVVVDKDATVDAPTEPTKDGCLFLGWFKADGTKYVFTSPVTSNLTLTAKWQRGSGTQESPYLIGTVEEWNDFADAVASGTTYEGKYFKMDANVGSEETPVTKMAGTYDNSNPKSFKGIFDGDRYALTVYYDRYAVGDTFACATFRSVDGATIKNLTLKGTLVNGGYCSAGFVGYALGTVSITDCVSEISLTPTEALGNRDADASGFVGWNSGTLTVTNSLFKGAFLRARNQYGYVSNMGASGFVGRDTGTTTLSSCIFAPVTLDMSSSYGAPFVYDGTPTLTNCYYTKSFGAVQGIRVYENADDIQSGFYDTVHILGNDWCAVNNVAIIGMSESYSHTGSTISVSYSVKNGDTTLTSGTDYTAQILKDGETVANVKDLGTYTLEITAKGSYHGVLRYTFYVLKELEGAGDQDAPYIIASDLDWVNFANRVTNGTDYASKFIKMTADIGSEANPVTVMAGNYNKSKSFKGTFDGNGHTLTISYVAETSYTAPFSSVSSGIIKNLTVNGSIETSVECTAGLAARASGTIENCLVNVSITGSKDNVGGIVYSSGTTTIKNCVFAGKFIGKEGKTGLKNWCGLVTSLGGSDTLTLTNCVFAPSEINLDWDSITCYRYWGNGYPTNPVCYYTVEYGRVANANQRGTLVYEKTEDYNGLCKKITTAGKNFYLPYETSVEGIEAVYSSVPNLSYTVKVKTDDDTMATLSKNSGYYESITNENGAYKLSIIGNELEGYSGRKTVMYYVAPEDLEGNGTEADPYLIHNAGEWARFANSVNTSSEQNVYAGNYIKLTADIGSTNFPVSIMIGTNGLTSHYFAGSLDGNDKTVTVAITTSEQENAPFLEVGEATIKNLTMAGKVRSIYTNGGPKCAGFIYHDYGNSVIENCTCSVTVDCTASKSTFSSYAKGAGFVYSVSGSSGASLAIKDSTFNGKLLGPSEASGNAGFVCAAVSGITVNIEDCLFDPQEITLGSTNSYTFAGGGATLNIANSYYTRTFGTVQGELQQ